MPGNLLFQPHETFSFSRRNSLFHSLKLLVSLLKPAVLLLKPVVYLMNRWFYLLKRTEYSLSLMANHLGNGE